MVKKLLSCLLSLWCIATVTFLLMHLIPGDPFIGDREVPEEVLNALRNYFGLNEPLYIQYSKYLKGLLSGDLGPSIVYEGRGVNELIYEGFPISAYLGLQALLMAVPTGLLLGVWAALKRGKWQDHLAMALATLSVSAPSFVMASFLQYLFSVKLKWLPVALWGSFEHTILPTIALALLPTAFIAKLTRASMVEVLEQDYIRTALAKGIPLFRVAIVHGLRNAILPVIAYLGPMTAHILTGSFMIEKIFAIPGLGQWMILSIHGRDYPMIMGLTLFFSALLLFTNLIVDLGLMVADPRLRKAHA